MRATASLEEPVEGPVADLETVIEQSREELRALQKEDGHWIFEFEPDATISSEYIMLRHFLGLIDEETEGKIANFIRGIQGEHGGWPLFHAGEPDVSATVKAYYALKLAGDDPDDDHMRRARALIHGMGGCAKVNVFTRIALALFGQVPWRAVPVMPVEIMFLPRWFPFHLSKVSYWSRTVIVPLLILMALKPKARNPKGIRVDELFLKHPDEEDYDMNPTGTVLGSVFAGGDRVLRLLEPFMPKTPRKRAIDAAFGFMRERLNGEDGLGGIYPAMANAAMAFDALDRPLDDPEYAMARHAVDRLLHKRDEETTYCQPCLSPIWDTCLGVHAMLEAGEDPDGEVVRAACDWLIDREVTETKGDWAWRRPDLKSSGWAFQYWNSHYPDVDDTAVVAMALDRTGNPEYRAAIERAAEWVLGMQSENGGWGAFDAENNHRYLNYIPFADHGALLDPPTVDVTARCLGMLAQLGYDRNHPAAAKAIDFLKNEQEEDGSWYGRWGINYIYGTWSALCALNAVGEDHDAPHIRKAVDYLRAMQQGDGGWGEDPATYWRERRGEVKCSTPAQTAWALLGLMAAGEVRTDEVERGIAFLQAAERMGPRWKEEHWTGIGFPRVFYIKYHGYAAYFPLWALSRYRNLVAKNGRRVEYGM